MSVEPTSYDRKLNLAYAAGLFDGEGCITYKKYKEKKSSGVYHYTSHKPTLENIIDLQYYKMFMAKKNKKEIYETK